MLPRARGKGRSTSRGEPLHDTHPPIAAVSAPNLYTWREESRRATLTRIVIEHVSPAVDGGLFAAKTSVGDIVPIEADVFTDGHDLPAARVLIRHDDADWGEVPMVPLGNDHWRSQLVITGARHVPLPHRGLDRYVGDVALGPREAP